MSAEAAYTGADNLEVMREARNYNAFLTSLIERYAPQTGRVLDFGAGAGTFARAVRGSGRTVLCVEVDPAQAAALTGEGFDTTLSSADLPEQSVDFLYSLNVLEHIEDDAAAAADLLRVLKPGHRALIYVPAFQILYSSMDRKVCHVRRYTRSTLRRALEPAGFVIEDLRYADSLGFFASLVFKVLGNDSGTINKGALIAYDRFAFPLSRLLDRLVGRLFGKNVYAVVRRP